MKLSQKYKAAIHELMKTKPAHEIAAGLNLGVKTVQRYIKTLSVKSKENLK